LIEESNQTHKDKKLKNTINLKAILRLNKKKTRGHAERNETRAIS